MAHLMIYGATGYTGRMVAEHAVAAGLPVILAGRGGAVLEGLAGRLGVTSRAFGLDDRDKLDAALSDVAVLLNCAGPFQHTAAPLMRAALRGRVHYLDIAAELDSYRLAEALDEQAKAAGVMLLPGSGGSVAMLGSLAARAAARVARPDRVSIALRISGPMSRGSAVSAARSLTARTLVRVDDALIARDPGGLKAFDFGEGPVDCFPVTLPDLITLARATSARTVETFVHVARGAFPEGDLASLPDGPTPAERVANRYQAAVLVTGADDRRATARLDAVNGYSFTALAAVEAARRVMAGESRPGFQTPAQVFGAGFAETIADTRITLIEGPDA